MTTTFETRLTGREGRALRFYVTIQGIPFVFQESSTTVSPAILDDVTDRTVMKNLVDVDRGSKDLDIERLRMVGGTAKFTLQDDNEGTLAALFAPRSRAVTFCAGAVDEDDNDFLADSVANIEVGQSLYIDGETVVVEVVDTAPTPDEFTAGRAAWGSEAQAHRGDSVGGAPIFAVPPSWLGRRVTLGGYFVDDRGRTSADLSATMDTFRLEEPPAHIGNGLWELRCSHLSDEIVARQVGTGLRDVAAGGDGRLTHDGTDFTFDVEDGEGEQFTQGIATTYARIENDRDGVLIFAIEDVTDDTVNLGGDAVNLVDGGDARRVVTSARHIVFIDGTFPGAAMLAALTSRLGDQTNGDYDILPGVDRSAYDGASWRFGAGIRIDEVDVDAFLDVGGSSLPGWALIIDDEFDVEQLLFDFCLATGSFWFITAEGLLSVARLAPERQASALTIDDTNLFTDPRRGGEPPAIAYDEASIHPRIELTCNYDPASREFEGAIRMFDAAMAARYPAVGDTFKIETRALYFEDVRRITGGGGTLRRHAMTTTTATSLLRRMQVGGGRGRALVTCRVNISAAVLDLGDVVHFTHAIPDLEGAATISGRVCRVIGIAPSDARGFFDLVLEILETLFHIAPACVIASRAGAVLTLRTTGPEIPDPFPGRMLGVGWAVRIFDISAGVHHDTVVDALTDTTVTLHAAPAFANENNVDFITLQPQQNAVATGIESANEFTPLEFTFNQAATPTGAPVTRWQ